MIDIFTNKKESFEKVINLLTKIIIVLLMII